MAAPAVGTIIQVYDGRWIALDDVSDISGPDFTKDEIDVTALDTTGGFRSFIGGLKDAGNVTLEMNFSKVTFHRLFGYFRLDGEPGVKWYAIIFNDSSTANDKSTFWFQASVNQTPIRASAGDRVTNTVTLRVSGEPKFGLAGGSARSVNGISFAASEILPADPTA